MPCLALLCLALLCLALLCLALLCLALPDHGTPDLFSYPIPPAFTVPDQRVPSSGEAFRESSPTPRVDL